MLPRPPKITSFLVKIASRCNLACDYCYVYQHADQTWRDMPPLMDERTRRQLALRVGEYAASAGLTHLLLVFHGGEPLLAGHDRIVETVAWVRAAVSPAVRVDAAVQTNGLLLTDEALAAFEASGVSVSVSIDGPPAVHDAHRLTHGGGPSHDRTMQAIRRLEARPGVYAGLIAVIDPSFTPESLLSFFRELNPPRVDFLLPDANHLRPPPGRDRNPDLYSEWLRRAFDEWFDRYPDLPVRTFDALLESVAGLPSGTDAFGFGDVSLLTIETDGSYHDLDVLKIAGHGATRTGRTVWESTVEEAAASEQIQSHRLLLTPQGVADACRKCPVVSVCGGGAVPHRFGSNGYGNPTVYCREMLALIHHVRERVQATLVGQPGDGISGGPEPLTVEELETFDEPALGNSAVAELQQRFSRQSAPRFADALRLASAAPTVRDMAAELLAADEETFQRLAAQPSAVLWASVTVQHASGVTPTDIDGNAVPTDPDYVRVMHGWLLNGLPRPPRLHRADPYLRLPFGQQIVFEPQEVAEAASELFRQAIEIIERFDPTLVTEMARVSPEVQLIRDPSAHPDKAVSFSDNSVPGALYVSVRRGSGWIAPHDLADSIIHEHRHQKLYLLQAACPIVAVDAPLVRSPWREDMRPPSGLFHAVFVFCGLLRYWEFVAADTTGATREYAAAEVRRVRENLAKARSTLFATALTERGRRLACRLYERVGEVSVDVSSP